MMQLRTWSSYLKLIAAMAAAGAVIALAISLALPASYQASAVIRAGPENSHQVRNAWLDAMSRRSLAEIIQRPRLDLYKGKRNRQPLEDVIEGMKKDSRLTPDGAGGFRVDFVYPDRFKAKAVADAITAKIADSARVHAQARLAVDPASLPETPLKPDRMVFLLSGLGAGLFAGSMVCLLKRRARWTLAVAAYALAGLAVAAALSLLIPDRYTSRAMLRVVPAPHADWLAKKSLKC